MEFRNRNRLKTVVTFLTLLALVALFIAACRRSVEDTKDGTLQDAGIPPDISAIAEARGLTPDDVAAALKTYTPTGQHDEYIMFASGGHAGQV